MSILLCWLLASRPSVLFGTSFGPPWYRFDNTPLKYIIIKLKDDTRRKFVSHMMQILSVYELWPENLIKQEGTQKSSCSFFVKILLFTLPYTLQVGTQEDAYKKSYLFIDICFGVFALNTAAVYISNYALRSILYLRI